MLIHHLIPFTLTAFGQKVEREIEVNYNYTMGSSQPSIDSVITEYDQNGNIINRGKNELRGLCLLANPVILDSVNGKVHGKFICEDGSAGNFTKPTIKILLLPVFLKAWIPIGKR